MTRKKPDKCDICDKRTVFIEKHIDERNKINHIFKYCIRHHTKAILFDADNIRRGFK